MTLGALLCVARHGRVSGVRHTGTLGGRDPNFLTAVDRTWRNQCYCGGTVYSQWRNRWVCRRCARWIAVAKVSADAADPIAPLDLMVTKTHEGRGVMVTPRAFAAHNRSDERAAAIVPVVLACLRARNGNEAPLKEDLFKSVKEAGGGANRNDFFKALKMAKSDGLILVRKDGRGERVSEAEVSERSAAQ